MGLPLPAGSPDGDALERQGLYLLFPRSIHPLQIPLQRVMTTKQPGPAAGLLRWAGSGAFSPRYSLLACATRLLHGLERDGPSGREPASVRYALITCVTGSAARQALGGGGAGRSARGAHRSACGPSLAPSTKLPAPGPIRCWSDRRGAVQVRCPQGSRLLTAFHSRNWAASRSRRAASL